MIVLAAVVVVWYVLGVLGCWAAALTDIDRGFDLTLRDVFIGAFLSLGGPIMFISGISAFIQHKDFFDRVLIKGKQ